MNGLLVGMASADPGMIYPSAIGELFDLRPRMLNVLDIGGASGAGMIWRAAAAIDAGICNAVLCLTADLNRMGRRRPPMISLMYEFEAPYGAIGANCSYALIAQRHLADDPHHCPHGRPTALLFSKHELERQFRRA